MKNEEMQTMDSEISLKDVVSFFRRNWRPIIFGGLIGFSFSVAYVVLAHKKYEAQWQVQMAEFVYNSGNGDSNSSSSSSRRGNVEEPAALVLRLRLPTAYTIEALKGCDMPEDGEFGEYLGGKLKVAVARNVNNAVEMTVRSSSPERARKCAEVIVDMLIKQQRGQIDDRLAGRQLQAAEYRQALQEEQQLLAKINKTELGNFAYLARLDKLSWLRSRIDALHEEALLSKMYPAKLVSPIYVPNGSVAPKVGLVLLLGLTLGLVLGVLFTIGREAWRKVV